MTRRTLTGAASLLALALAGCAGARPPAKAASASGERVPHPSAATARDHRAEVCAAPSAPVGTTFHTMPAAEPPDGERVVEVAVRGARHVPEAMIREVMKIRVGGFFDAAEADADLLRVERLSAFSDVRLGWERSGGGVRVTVEVDERPLVGAVYLDPAPTPALEPGTWMPPLAGDLYDPSAVDRAIDELLRLWHAEGYLDATARAHALRVDPARVDLCFDLDRGRAWVVDRIEAVGSIVVPGRELVAQVSTRDGAYDTPGKPYRADLLRADLLRMSALLYDRGLIDARVGSPRVIREPDRGALRVEIPVVEGQVYRIGRVRIQGRLAGPRSRYAALLPAPGEIFSRARWVSAMEKVGARHRALTGRTISTEPQMDMHRDRGIVDVVLVVKGG